MAMCGYQISFTHEVYSQSPILPERTYQLINGEGFVLSEQGGIPGMYLIAIANEQFDDPMVLRGAKQIMRRAIHHVLDGKELKTRGLYPYSKRCTG